jgi:hypothetical protein
VHAQFKKKVSFNMIIFLCINIVYQTTLLFEKTKKNSHRVAVIIFTSWTRRKVFLCRTLIILLYSSWFKHKIFVTSQVPVSGWVRTKWRNQESLWKKWNTSDYKSERNLFFGSNLNLKRFILFNLMCLLICICVQNTSIG